MTFKTKQTKFNKNGANHPLPMLQHLTCIH